MMYLVTGLGNPGEEHANTRHNVGFRAVHLLSDTHNIKNTSYKFRAMVARGKINQRDVLLAQPLTYMNKSGEAVKLLMRNYNISPQKLIVVYDDLDLPTGRIRIKKKGSAGGHKGMDSIIRIMQTEEIPRIRIGIDQPPDDNGVIDYVLGYFKKEEEKLLKSALEKVVEAVETIFMDGFDEAMNKFN